MDLSTDLLIGSYKKKKGNITEVVDADPSVDLNAATYCRMVEMLDDECYIRSILELWDYSERKIKRLSKQDILDQVNKYKENPLLGSLKNYHELLGGIKRNESGFIVEAEAMQTFFHIYVNFSSVDMDKSGNNAGTADFVSRNVKYDIDRTANK